MTLFVFATTTTGRKKQRWVFRKPYGIFQEKESETGLLKHDDDDVMAMNVNTFSHFSF